mgnify:CR=1 FL=1
MEDLVISRAEKFSLIKNCDFSKTSFLEDYAKKNISDKEICAYIYQQLGNIYSKSQNPRGEYFEKAGSLFEDLWAENSVNKGLSVTNPRKLLKLALKNYKMALKNYYSGNLHISAKRAGQHISNIYSELVLEPNLFRKSLIFIVFISFLFSVYFFSSGLTGFTVAELESDNSIFVGGMLFLTGVAILFCLLKLFRLNS